MKSEPNAGPNAVVSFDALLTLALQEQTRRELAALPDAEALQTLYPDTAGWDKRLRRALAERRKLESKAAHSAPRVRWMPLRRLVTVAAVLVLVLAGALATSAEVRYAVRHAVLQWTDIDLRLTYDTEGTPAPADLTLPKATPTTMCRKGSCWMRKMRLLRRPLCCAGTKMRRRDRAIISPVMRFSPKGRYRRLTTSTRPTKRLI